MPIVGPIHGVLFMLFMLLTWMFSTGIERRCRGDWRCAASLARIIPFGPFVVDRWLAETNQTAPTL